jgi:hypothetical protein
MKFPDSGFYMAKAFIILSKTLSFSSINYCLLSGYLMIEVKNVLEPINWLLMCSISMEYKILTRDNYN